MIRFIEDHRDAHGVEPICRVLPIAPATFYDHLAKRADPSRLSDRAPRDTELKPEIERVFKENLSVYGVRKVWHQMRREGFDVARCTVARLMNDTGIEGVVRGKRPTDNDSRQGAAVPIGQGEPPVPGTGHQTCSGRWTSLGVIDSRALRRLHGPIEKESGYEAEILCWSGRFEGCDGHLRSMREWRRGAQMRDGHGA